MRVLLLLAFGLPVLVAQSLVARVELQSGACSVVSGAVRERVATPSSSTLTSPGLLGTQRRSDQVGARLAPKSPEGSAARALIYVQHHRRQAT
jgi:hypothetical protein